jgi:hypothetical protein
MGFESDLLIESLMLGLLLGVGLALVVIVELARIPWIYRAATPVAMAWLLLPTKAHPAITYFLLTSFEVLVVLEIVRWWRGRQNPQNPSKPAPTFTLRFMFSAMALIAAVCGVGVIAVQDISHLLSQVGSSVASSSLILAVVWCALTRRRKLVRVAVLFAALLTSTALWHFTVWFDIYETRTLDNLYLYRSRAPAMLVLCDAMFGLLIAVCTAAMILACRNKKAVPTWQVRLARCVAFPLIMAVVLLGSYFYYRLARPLKIPSTVLPNPNGHTYFAEAGSSLRSVTVPDIGTAQPAVIAQFVSNHRETLSLVRRGLELDCKTALIWKEGAEHFTKEVDALQNAREVARLFQAETFMHAESENFAEAAQSSIDCIRFGHAMSRQGLIVHFLVQSAIEGIGTRELHRFVEQLNASTARAAAGQLLQVDAEREPQRDFTIRDELWTQVVFGWASRLQLANDDLFNRPDRFGSTFNNLELRDEVVRRLLIVELALHAFTLEKGNPPDQLSGLIPEHLPHVPNDPYSNAPLRYRLQGTTATVYSVGPDLDDDSAQGLTWEAYISEGDGDVVLSTIFEGR